MASQSQRPPWLFGPWSDLLFGCGLLYMLAFTLFLFAGGELRTAQPALVFTLLTLVLSTPHYGATLLRVYERRRDRRAFAVFSVWITLAIFALFLAALRLPLVATLMVTLYLTWSPWHYSGQNYGLAVMFLRRGGVPLDATTKRWLYLSFLLSFVLVFLQNHTAAARVNDLPVGYTSERGASFLPLGIPLDWAFWIGSLVAIAYVAALGICGVRLARRAALRLLLAPALLAVSQLLWFSLPLILQFTRVATTIDPLNWQFRTHYFMWIAVAHALQYLWVTAYYARQSGAWSGHTHFYAKTLLAGAAAWTLPFLVFGPQALGPLSADAGLAMLVASAVNIHHFVLDGAIWKLKGRIAEVLIRSGSELADAAASVRRFGLRPLVWAVCAVALVAGVATVVDEEIYRHSFLARDIERAKAAHDRLVLLGMDRGSVRLALGRALLREGRPAEAREQLLRSIELAPTPAVFIELGMTYQREESWLQAAQAFRTALTHEMPRDRALATLWRAANAWLAAGYPENALELLARAPQGDPRFQELTARARGELAARSY